MAFFVGPRPSARLFAFLFFPWVAFFDVAFAVTLAGFVAFTFFRDGFCFEVDRSVALGLSVFVVISVFIVSSFLAVDPRVTIHPLGSIGKRVERSERYLARWGRRESPSLRQESSQHSDRSMQDP